MTSQTTQTEAQTRLVESTEKKVKEVTYSPSNALTAANTNQARLSKRIHQQRLRIRELEAGSIQKKTKEVNSRAIKLLEETLGRFAFENDPDGLGDRIRQLILDYKTPPTQKQKERTHVN